MYLYNILIFLFMIGYIIIGTGRDKFFLEESIYERFAKLKIRVDVLPTVIIYLES